MLLRIVAYSVSCLPSLLFQILCNTHTHVHITTYWNLLPWTSQAYIIFVLKIPYYRFKLLFFLYFFKCDSCLCFPLLSHISAPYLETSLHTGFRVVCCQPAAWRDRLNMWKDMFTKIYGSKYWKHYTCNLLQTVIFHWQALPTVDNGGPLVSLSSCSLCSAVNFDDQREVTLS